MIPKRYKVHYLLAIILFITLINACSAKENQVIEIKDKEEQTQSIQRYPTPQDLK